MKTKKGTTIVEVLVAIAVLTIGLLALYEAIISGMRFNLKAKHRSIAYNVSSQEREILRGTSFASLNNQTEGAFLGTVSGLDKLPQGVDKLTIENYEGSSDIKKITIKVQWQESKQSKEVKITTLIYKEGLNQ